MNIKITKIFFSALAILLIAISCNEEYDPIGPNKPSPVLILTPLELAFNGSGGTLSSKISTNAEEITLGDLPDWIESATISEDNTTITVVAKANTTSYDVRRSNIRLTCFSGDNSVTQDLKLYEAGKDSKLSFAAFSGKSLPAGWTADDPSTVSIGNSYLSLKATGAPGYLYTPNTSFSPEGQKYFFSVDIRMNGGEGGVKLYVNENPLQVVEIYMGYNAATNRGGIWVKNGETWCAMDDGTIGSGDCPNKFNDVSEIPSAEERDDWWRLCVFTTETTPNEPVVEVRSLKTFNGETREIAPNYSRKFSFVKADQGSISLWGRNRESQFRNYVLSYQE